MDIKLEEINPFVRYVHVFGKNNIFYSQYHTICDSRCFLIRRGEMELVVDGTSYHLSHQQMLLVPAGCAYYFAVMTPNTEVLGINFDYTRQGAHKRTPMAPIPRERFSQTELSEQATITDFTEFQKVIFIQNATRFLNVIREIEAEYAMARALSDAATSAQMKQLLVGIAEGLRLDFRATETVNEVISYIQSHCTERISNTEIGQALNFHPNYLNRLMQKHTGKSLHAYLVHCRLMRAIQMLQTTSLSVAEIAGITGFGDLQQFCKSFRQATGHTPSEFRRLV